MPDPHSETLSGLIERVTFHSEESGFSVLRVKAKGHREPVTVIGSLAGPNAGEWIEATGRWQRDPRHGLQLKAETLRTSPPSSREGIEKYLASGLIHGIGPVYAKKLVAHFGEALFDVIDTCSARLEEIDGIGPGRRRRIKDAWAEQKAVREIMVFLHSCGASTSRAVRIFKLYGDAAIEKVRADPYALARDIHGIGFKTADQIAEKVGIARNSPLRARAGIDHVLLEAADQGHCALPVDRLSEAAHGLLQAADAPVEAALEEMIAADRLIRERIGDLTLVFSPAMRRAEQEIAARINRMTEFGPTLPSIDPEKAIPWCEARTGKQLAGQQRAALGEALRKRLLVITGGPGVGKTTLIHSLLLILRAKEVRCLLCAPTGRAAKRMSEATGIEAKTIHRLLEFDPRTGDFSRCPEHPLECDLLVVDETSMVDVPLMAKLLRALPDRAHALLVGDPDQLPSVGPGLVLRDLIACPHVPVVRLDQIFRQAAASRIVGNAHRVRQGQLIEPSADAAAASDFFVIERDTPEAIQAALLALVTERIPRRLGCDAADGIQVITPMNRGSLGTQALNALLQDALNPAKEPDTAVERFGWHYRTGDKVIQTRNNYDKDVFNGDLGRVGPIDAEEKTVAVAFEGRAVPYAFHELDELAPAYAITVHKSQGSEFPAVVLPLSTQHFPMLQRNLLYTGMTRGKRLVVLVGQQKAIAMATRNNETARRYSGLAARLEAG
jgi:exodeoxyribonuclease V alpha subunit